jgi:hypothetical protein
VTLGHYSLRSLAQDFHILESQMESLAIRHYQKVDASDLRQEYLWNRSNFFIQIAALCGEDHSEAESILDDTVMEFSL